MVHATERTYHNSYRSAYDFLLNNWVRAVAVIAGAKNTVIGKNNDEEIGRTSLVAFRREYSQLQCSYWEEKENGETYEKNMPIIEPILRLDPKLTYNKEVCLPYHKGENLGLDDKTLNLSHTFKANINENEELI